MRLNFIPSLKPNYNTYGYIYNWYAVTNAANIAASGWHVPTDAEWTTFTTWLVDNGYGYEGTGTDIAKSMASTSGWTANGTGGNVGNDQGTNNSSGFNGKPAGLRIDNGTFENPAVNTRWWSPTVLTGSLIWVRGIFHNAAICSQEYLLKKYGLSIRLLKDDSTLATYTGNDGKIYATIKLGNQVWMSTNLRETKYQDTTDIPIITDATDWSNDVTGARCSNNNA
jgi:uncharacterized protein (TIGR02145 family)